MPPHHVLVVGADSDAASVVRAAAVRKGAGVTEMEDGIDAVTRMTGQPGEPRHPLPRLLVLDLDAPSAEGYEVLHWMARSRLLRSVPVIALSSSVERADEEAALALGVSLYMRKPVASRTLELSVTTLLEPAEADGAPP